MFTVEVAKELLIIMHSDKQLMQTSCLVMNGWSSNWTELSLNPACLDAYFFLCLWPVSHWQLKHVCDVLTPRNNFLPSFSTVLCPAWQALFNQAELKKGNSMGKNVWFKTHVYLATTVVYVAQQRPRFSFLPQSEIAFIIRLYRCGGKCSSHRQEEESQNCEVIRRSIRQWREMKWTPENSTSVSQSWSPQYRPIHLNWLSSQVVITRYVDSLLSECSKKHAKYDGNPDVGGPVRSVFFVNPCLYR